MVIRCLQKSLFFFLCVILLFLLLNTEKQNNHHFKLRSFKVKFYLVLEFNSYPSLFSHLWKSIDCSIYVCEVMKFAEVAFSLFGCESRQEKKK